MKSWTSHSLWRITSVLLIQVTLLCSAGGESRDLDYPDQVLPGRFILQPRELHGNDYRRQLAITREARSENNPRLMSIDLSALARHPLGPGIGSSGFARPSKLMAIDLSVLSRNPDPRLPLIQLPFPDPWDIGMNDPIFPGRARSPFHPPPLAESKNTVQDSMDIFGETREEKKQAEPNTESNSIPIFGEHSSPFRRTSEDRRTFRHTDPEGEEDLINNVRLPHRKRDGRQLEIRRDPRLTPALLLRNLSLRSRELQPAATSAQDAADSQYSFDDRDYLNKLDYTE